MRVLGDNSDSRKLQSIRKFRTAWPWEQDRQMAIYNNTSDKIQISSQPENAFMRRQKGSQLVSGGWCLSHLPRSGCFISHFCANQGSKAHMNRKYRELIKDDMYQLRYECVNYRTNIASLWSPNWSLSMCNRSEGTTHLILRSSSSIT